MSHEHFLYFVDVLLGRRIIHDVAEHGLARLGVARQGESGRSEARNGEVRRGTARCGQARHGMTRQGEELNAVCDSESREKIMSVSAHANVDVPWFVKDVHGRIAVINERNKEVAGPFTSVADAWKWIRWNLPQAESRP